MSTLFSLAFSFGPKVMMCFTLFVNILFSYKYVFLGILSSVIKFDFSQVKSVFNATRSVPSKFKQMKNSNSKITLTQLRLTLPRTHAYVFLERWD